jgi:hypothetical protein
MTKKKAKIRSDRLFANLQTLSLSQNVGEDGDESSENLTSIQGQVVRSVTDSSSIPRMKKFRFQLLHQWLINTLQPCKVADIGGGKGLLSYLLIQSSWEATVIDPVTQSLPGKYKDILTGKRAKINPQAMVPQIQSKFETLLAEPFDLLIGLHAHGCNVKILDAAASFGCGFVIFPCCVIDEPFFPPLGVHWLESLADYALKLGHSITPFRLNFKGQNIGLYSAGKCQEINK